MSNRTSGGYVGPLDQPIVHGFRLWMLLAIVFLILLSIMVATCCLVRIRIPRTKREIEEDAFEKGRDRRASQQIDRHDRRKRVGRGRSSNQLSPPNAEGESGSCTTCATCEHTPINVSNDSLHHQHKCTTTV